MASRGRLCGQALHAMYNRPQQQPSPWGFISKIGRKTNWKKWRLKALTYTRSTIYVERLMFSLGFRALSSEGILCINFLK